MARQPIQWVEWLLWQRKWGVSTSHNCLLPWTFSLPTEQWRWRVIWPHNTPWMEAVLFLRINHLPINFSMRLNTNPTMTTALPIWAIRSSFLYFLTLSFSAMITMRITIMKKQLQHQESEVVRSIQRFSFHPRVNYNIHSSIGPLTKRQRTRTCMLMASKRRVL